MTRASAVQIQEDLKGHRSEGPKVLLVNDNRCATWKEHTVSDGREQVSAPRGVHHG